MTPDLWSLGMGRWVSGEVGVSTATPQDRTGVVENIPGAQGDVAGDQR